MNLDIAPVKKKRTKPAKKKPVPTQTLDLAPAQAAPGVDNSGVGGMVALSSLAFVVGCVGFFYSFPFAIRMLGLGACLFPTLYFRGKDGAVTKYPRLACFTHLFAAVVYLCLIIPSSIDSTAPAKASDEQSYIEAVDRYVQVRTTHEAEMLGRLKGAEGKELAKGLKAYIVVLQHDADTEYKHGSVPDMFAGSDRIIRDGQAKEIEGYKQMLAAAKTKNSGQTRHGKHLRDEGRVKISEAIDAAHRAATAKVNRE